MAAPKKRHPYVAGPVDMPGRGRSFTLALAAAMLLAPAGCIRGSLATSTGPNGPDRWSADSLQQAHLGETVRYSFILVSPFHNRPLDPYGYADYCITSIGDHRVLCEPDLGGRFRFQHSLSGVKAGDRIKVTATAYRQHGSRDFMRVGDTWLRGESPVDQPDRRVCSDSLTLCAYQAKVEIPLPGGTSPFDFESGKLQLIRSDGDTSSVFIGRPNRPGFTASRPDGAGDYSIVYLPDGDELNPSGQTRTRFTVHDLAGHPHSAETMVSTP